MKKKVVTGRRKFLKTAVAGAAAAAAGTIAVPKAIAQNTQWSAKMQINPEIDNLRVAMVEDENMVKKQIPNSWDFRVVNENMNRDAIRANLDAMAMYLAQESNASDAWRKIFRKPSLKTWDDVRVALKVNCIESKQMIKIYIVEKICDELINLGALGSKMVVWDGVHNADGTGKYTPYEDGKGLPAGVKVSNRQQLLGGMAAINVPAPFNKESDATADLVNGKVDILVNFAVNKGHGSSRGNTTLSLKNHFGTFDPQQGGHDGYSNNEQFNYLIGMNKSSAILGGDPVRQQLIIVDSIYAMTHGPTGAAPNHAPYKLVMGTFAPAVDYATVKLIREEDMKASHSSYAERFLTEFGYSETERDNFISMSPEVNGGKGVGMVKAGQTNATAAAYKQSHIFFHLLAGKYKSQAVKINFPSSEKITSVSIFTPQGKIIAKLSSLSAGNRGVVWDGRDSYGSYVSSGTYLVEIKGRSSQGSGKIVVG